MMPRIFRLDICAGLGLFAVAALVLAEGGQAAQRYALLVGVNECPDFRLPDGGLPRPLRGAEQDALAMAKLLQERYAFPQANVELLTGADATQRAITDRLKHFATRLTADDVFLFHFSGHGTQCDDLRPFDEHDRLDEALCPHDAQADGRNLIRDDVLGLLLSELPARRITVVLDCCHAGTGVKDAASPFRARFLPAAGKRRGDVKTDAERTPWRDIRSATKNIGTELTAFYACQSQQQAYERRLLDTRPPRSMGQFTRYLIAGLRDDSADADRDGQVSNSEILDYVRRQLDDNYNRFRKDASEHQLPEAELPRPDEPLFGIAR